MPLSPPTGPTTPLLEHIERMIVASQLGLQTDVSTHGDTTTVNILDPHDELHQAIQLVYTAPKTYAVYWTKEGVARADIYEHLHQAVLEALTVVLSRRIDVE